MVELALGQRRSPDQEPGKFISYPFGGAWFALRRASTGGKSAYVAHLI